MRAMVIAVGLITILVCGCQGGAGLVGPQGQPGPTGPSGPRGETGSAGPIGPEGPQGAMGTQGPPGAQGMTGPQGPQGIPGAAGKMICTPGKGFCEGTVRWKCSKLGLDATDPFDCAVSYPSWYTANNPIVCATDHCASWDTVCCRSLKPTTVNFTQPAWVGAAYLLPVTAGVIPWVLGAASDPTLDIAQQVPYGPCTQTTLSGFYRSAQGPPTVCPSASPSGYGLQIGTFDTKNFPAGQTVTVTPSGATVVNFNNGTSQCTKWNGTVRVVYPPSWSVTTNLTCSTNSAIALVGTIAGEQ